MREREPDRKTKTIVIICVALVLALVVGIVVALSLNKSGKGKKDNGADDLIPESTASHAISTPEPTPQPEPEPEPEPAVEPEPEPEPELEPESSEPEEEEKEKNPATEGPLEFVAEPKAGELQGKTVTVEFKTNRESTVNAIISTSDTAPGVSGFYDYYKRNEKNENYVGKQSVFMVTQNGTTASFEIPDKEKTYYLILNAVDNESEEWQNTTTVVKLYSPE